MNEIEYFEHIEKSIEEIEAINCKNSWAYEQIIFSILKIQKLPLILYHFQEGNHVFRSRINKGIIPFESISDISIPKEKFVNDFGRANKPKQSVFYGSENRPTSYLEFAMHLAKETPFNEEVSLTVGQWELQRDLTFILIYDPNLPRNTEYNKLHGEAFDDFLTKIPEEFIKGTIRFFEFIGQKFSELAENKSDYLITCAYSNIVYAHEQCDGIIYPSVPRAGDGFNIAIKENIIEEGVLALKSARMDKFVATEQENGKHNFLNNASMEASQINTELDRIEWNNDWQQHIKIMRANGVL